jgi:glucose-6-phosphate isomerase
LRQEHVNGAEIYRERLLNYKGKLINDLQTVAETFNNYFTEVVEESVSKVIKHDYNQVNNETSLENLVHGPYKLVNLMPVTGKEMNEIKII